MRTRNTASQLRIGFFEASAPDLSGVLTDGTHVLYGGIATAGQRNFSSIAAVKNTQQTDTGAVTSATATLIISNTTGYSVGDILKVAGAGAAGADLYSTILTVDSSIQLTLNDNAGTTAGAGAVTNPKQVTLTASQGVNTGATDTAWAIGGKRASIGGTTSVKLLENNGSNGDAMPGWTLEMQSGHIETIAATVTLRRNGTQAAGRIAIRGASGAVTPPIVTFSNNGICFRAFCDLIHFKDFELRNSNATKTASYAIYADGGTGGHLVENVRIDHSTNKFYVGIVLNKSADTVINCQIGNTASFGISIAAACFGQNVISNRIYSTGGNGIDISSTSYGLKIIGNLITGCAGDGIHNSDNTSNFPGFLIMGNTIDSCTSDGVEFTVASSDLAILCVINNILSNNGGYGLNFSSGTVTSDYLLNGSLALILNNNTYNNTSGAYNPASVGTNDPGLNPNFTNPGSVDYSIGTNLKAKGHPLGGTLYIGTTSSTYSYMDPGAAQRQEAGGGGNYVIGSGVIDARGAL